ncbi:MAG: biosynthetic arginine decarboxylase [Acidobacteria bacterium]|nr:biosynthetic arginine decarboxylase [Acidobacteriota bacterium]
MNKPIPPSTEDTAAQEWTPTDAAALYQIEAWGADTFEVGPAGHVLVMPRGPQGPRVDLYEVVTGLAERGINTPVLIGFRDLLARRMELLREAFGEAIEACGYRGEYTPVYPIKVNQHRYLVEQIERIGRETGLGLEVGSKPELLAVMGLTTETPDRLIICNGFKEAKYIHQYLLATKLGRNIIAVVENIAELEVIIEQAQATGIRPRIGIRVKLSRSGSGRWHQSSGEKAKFGLTIPGILEAVSRLKEAGMLDCLELLHCHMGSQITDIQVVNAGITELAQVFVQLQKLGTTLRYIDAGGGLGIDYDGSQTTWEFSTNYTLTEYAMTVVYRIQSVCDDAGIRHPGILTETGRAMVSHHSVLVFDVLGAAKADRWIVPDAEIGRLAHNGTTPRVISDLIEAVENAGPGTALESYHDAVQAHEEALTLFTVGHLSLEHRGLADRLYWTVCLRINSMLHQLEQIPDELEELQARLSDTLYCNFSVFQSLPDSWAINQVFPVMPIHRLDEEPARRATLADITCDSDGHIDRFINAQGATSTLPVHELRPGEPYFLAVFLVGAYQETLGDLHNLFGDTHLVHITVDNNGVWTVEELVEGDTVDEVLGYLQYDHRLLYQAIRRDCERAVRAGRMTPAESRALLANYNEGLTGYTYLE